MCARQPPVRRPSTRVALIEAGPLDTPSRSSIFPATVGAAIGTPELNWRFMTAPQAHLNGRAIPHSARARGRRLRLHQRHGLFPRPSDGLRRLGGSRQSGLELPGGAALLPALGEQRGLSRLAVSRPGRPDERHVRQAAQSHDAGVPRGHGGDCGFSAPTTSTARTPKATARGRAPSPRGVGSRPPRPI